MSKHIILVSKVISSILILLSCCLISVPAKAAVSAKKMTLAAGESCYILAGNSNTGYTWSSSDKTVADVTDGVVAAKKAGTVRITAAANGMTKVYDITVKKYRIEKKSPTMKVGERMQLRFKGISVSKAVRWTSSDSDILTVNEFGTVTAVSSGTAKIKGKVGKSSVTTTIKVVEGNVSHNVETPFKTNIKAADIAYIKYTPALFSDRKSEFVEKSNYITDSREIENIVYMLNARDYLPLSDEEINDVYRDDLRYGSKKFLTSYTVRDSMILYDKKGNEVAAALSGGAKGYDGFKLARLYMNGKYYKCNDADTGLTAACNHWKSESELITAAKKYCKVNGRSVSGKKEVKEYFYMGFNNYDEYLDKTYIIALVRVGKNYVLVAPATGRALSFEDIGSDDR